MATLTSSGWVALISIFFMTLSSWRRNRAVRRRYLPPVLAISPPVVRYHTRGALERSGVLVTLPATRLWRPDSQSAPRHLVSRVSLCLPRGARTAIGAGGLGAVDSQFSYRHGHSKEAGLVALIKSAGEAWGRCLPL
jgi:hypothetical protein